MKIQQFGKISVFTLDRKFIYLYFLCQTKSIHLELKTSWKLFIFLTFIIFLYFFQELWLVELSTKLFKRNQLFDLFGSMFHISLLSHLFLTRLISFSYFLFFTLYLSLTFSSSFSFFSISAELCHSSPSFTLSFSFLLFL